MRNIVVFFRPDKRYGEFSNWYKRDFIVDGTTYNCMEQYMMDQKALLFDDTYVHTMIMRSTEPTEMKAWGRKVRDFDQDIWDEEKYDIIVIIDEAYGEYMNQNNSAIKLVEKYDNIVVLRSASKFYGLPNHRVGYLFSSKAFVKIYNEVTIPFPFSDLSANVYRNIIKNHKEMDLTKQKVMEIKKKLYILNQEMKQLQNSVTIQEQ